MTHYAKVNQGRVIQVIVAEQEFIDNMIDNSPGVWIKTSYNTYGGVHYEPDSSHQIPSEDQTKSLRKNFATVGGVYDVVRDAFYESQPYPSWTLDETTCIWQPPVGHPGDGLYDWDEENQQWVQYSE